MLQIIDQVIVINAKHCYDVILNQISNDIHQYQALYLEYNIHDFANQHGNLSVNDYIVRIKEKSTDTFHIVVLNEIDWRNYGEFKKDFPIGNVQRFHDNVILTCVQSGREEDDVVCLRLLDILSNYDEFVNIHDRKIIIKTDDDMTRPQHGLSAIAHRYYNTWIYDENYGNYKEKLLNFYTFLRKRIVGTRGEMQAIVSTQDVLDRRLERFK